MSVFKKSFLILMSISIVAQGMSHEQCLVPKRMSHEQCLEWGEKYIKFLNDYGKSCVSTDYLENVFSPSYTSIFNNELVVWSRNHLDSHLGSMKNDFKGWKVKIFKNPTIDTVDPTACSVTFTWCPNQGGFPFLITAVIKLTADGQYIESINEVGCSLKYFPAECLSIFLSSEE